MRLFELDSLPKKAGLATLAWDDGYMPSRIKEDIYLPKGDDVQYFPIKNGAQFLVTIGVQRTRLFFGGTDERPFLVEMNPDVLLGLKNVEKGFYDAIKPEGAKFCEKKFGKESIRQGDWFAVPIPLNFDTAHGLLDLFIQNNKFVTKNKNNGISIGGTRHLLIDGQLVVVDQNYLRCTGIAEGLLRAPDHEDKVLKGPHALFQTRHLVDPKKAD